MSGEEAPAETETERETERETEGTSGSQEAAVDKNEGDTTQNVQTKEEENAGSYSTLCRDMFGKIAEYINGELAGNDLVCVYVSAYGGSQVAFTLAV